MAIDSTDQTQPVITESKETVLREPEPDDNDTDEGGADQSASDQNGQAQRLPNGQFQPRQPGQRMSRQERRAARQQEIDRAVGERTAALERSFNERFDRMLQGLASQRQQPVSPQQQAPDPAAAEMQTLQNALQAEIAAFQAHDRSKGNYDLGRYYQIQQRMQEISASRGAERAAFMALQRLGLTPDMVRRFQAQQSESNIPQHLQQRFYTLLNEFEWMANPEHAKAVRTYKDYLITVQGRPDGLATDREAAAHVAAARRLGGGQLPRGNEQRYAGVRGDAGADGGGQREVRLPSGVLNGLTPDELQRAQRNIFAK